MNDRSPNIGRRIQCYLKFTADTGTTLAKLLEYKVMISGRRLLQLVAEDQTTQIDVTLRREPEEKLFVFHAGDDDQLHVEWDRAGNITKRRIEPK